MTDTGVDNKRRRLLTIATTGVGLAGVAGLVVPFVGSFGPSKKAKAAGAPVEVDISKLETGQRIVVEWRGKPVWVVRRSTEVLSELGRIADLLVDPLSEVPQQPEYAKNLYRSSREDILILVGICTHLGCSPTYQPAVGEVWFDSDWHGGFFCACHGSKFDLAGRVFKSVPAPTNLVVPPYSYLSDDVIVVGVNPEEVAS